MLVRRAGARIARSPTTACVALSAGLFVVAPRVVQCEALQIKPAALVVARRPKILDEVASLTPWSDRVLYAVAAFASMFASIARNYQTRIIGTLFDALSTGAASVPAVRSLLGIYLAQAGCTFVASVALATATTHLGANLRKAYFAAVLRQDMEYFDVVTTGSLAGTLSEDIKQFQSYVRTTFTSGIQAATGLVSGSVLLYGSSPKMAFVVFGLLPLGGWVANNLGVLLRNLSEKQRVAGGIANGIASEAFSSVRTIRAFNAEGIEMDRYSTALDEVSRLKMQTAFAAGSFYAGIGLGVNLSTLVMLGLGAHLVHTGELSTGGIASVVTQVQMLQGSIARISTLAASTSKALVSSAHVFEMIRSTPVVNSSNKNLSPPLEWMHGRIKFQNVSHAYPTRPNDLVLKNFNLTIERGTTVALVGASGSGKSTIASLLERFYDPVAGIVSIDDVDVRDLNPSFLHGSGLMSIVSQSPDLFSGTLRDNLRIAKPNASDEELLAALEQANALEFATALPAGLSTVLSERGASLSGGQRQRIAIARAVLADPKILILDEATSALDSESESSVVSALTKLMKGRTTVVIAHRLSTIRNADVILVLKGGEIIERGSHHDLIAKDESVYQDMLHRAA